MENNRLKFTKRSIEALPIPANGRTYYYDTAIPGLACCITSSGNKSFYRIGRVNGRPVRLLLGKFPNITVEQAGQQCKEFSGAIAKGGDPQAERQAARVEQTLGALFDWWIETHAKLHRKVWPEDQRRFDQLLAHWKSRRLSSISKSEVQALHAKVGKENGHVTANRLLSMIRAVFNKADGIGFKGDNPTKGIQKFAEHSRDRFLQPDEVPKLFAALNNEDQLFRDFFLIALLTGARRRNVQSMRWEDIRLDAAVWRIPETKAGVPVVVHLPEKAVEILTRRKDEADQLKSQIADRPKQKQPTAERIAENAKTFVFYSHGKTGHLETPSFAWKRVCESAGLKNIRIHDLRRTLGSWQAIGGSSLTVIGKSLGHTSLASTAVYARLSTAPVVESVNNATNAILAAATPTKSKATKANT